MEEFIMRLNPAVAEEGKKNIEKSNTKGKIALIMIFTSLIIAECLITTKQNIRVLSTKNGNELMFYTDDEVKNNEAKGQTLAHYEKKNIKRILKK